DGEYVASIGLGSGDGPGELNRPSGVAIDKDGDVYVVDWGNYRLNVYAEDGDFLTSFVGDADKLPKWAQDSVDAPQGGPVARVPVPPARGRERGRRRPHHSAGDHLRPYADIRQGAGVRRRPREPLVGGGPRT
ncbi:MAG: hypothetical protein J4F43_10275, partial [Dehalococcoidia bacterium]|nr:hypothetical protein [Dehalococcoidia bacterium]